jgi:hypothetical protein
MKLFGLIDCDAPACAIAHEERSSEWRRWRESRDASRYSSKTKVPLCVLRFCRDSIQIRYTCVGGFGAVGVEVYTTCKVRVAYMSWGGAKANYHDRYENPVLNAKQPTFVFTGDTSKLQGAPSFSETTWPDISQSSWRHSIYSYYGISPNPACGGSGSPGSSSTGSVNSPGTTTSYKPGNGMQDQTSPPR